MLIIRSLKEDQRMKRPHRNEEYPSNNTIAENNLVHLKSSFIKVHKKGYLEKVDVAQNITDNSIKNISWKQAVRFL